MTNPTPTPLFRYPQTERALLVCTWTLAALAALVLSCGLLLELSSTSSHGRIMLAVISTVAASVFAGVVLGLLFGIPAIGPNGSPASRGDNESEAAASSSKLVANDSLVRISQWLTTIIVGITIAQFREVVEAIRQIGEAVASAVLCSQSCASTPQLQPGIGTTATGAAAVLAFTIGGFLLSYLWTRVYLPGELIRSESDALRVSRSERQAINDNIIQDPPAAATPGMLVQIRQRQEERKATVTRASNSQTEVITPGSNPDDPWKGAFGGLAENAGYSVKARIGQSRKDSDYFLVDLLVTRPADSSAKTASFYLHPSFPKPRRKARFDADGIAMLPLLAWGAFTVGIVIDDGIRLELDLAELPNAPDEFRSR